MRKGSWPTLNGVVVGFDWSHFCALVVVVSCVSGCRVSKDEEMRRRRDDESWKRVFECSMRNGLKIVDVGKFDER